MKISGIALLDGEENNLDLASTSRTVSTSRGTTLNPEANVFNLPVKSKLEEPACADDDGTEVHPFMNGDVGKLSCRDYSPGRDNADSQNTVVKMDAHLTDHCSSGPATVGSCPLASDSIDISSKEFAMSEIDSRGINSYEPNVTEHENQDQLSSEIKSLVVESHVGVAEGPKEYIGNDDTGQLPAISILKDGSQYVEGQDAESQPGEADPQTSDREHIKHLISEQVEYFFSRENWSSDRYLLSQMDSDQYVPIYILASCAQFKSITKDHSIILDALKDSLFVQLDEEHNRVRPNYKRCIVILREIAESTPVKEIEAMFEGEGCPKALSCEFVHNASWYVTFETDNDAQKAYRYLRETVKTFYDKPILARIKTKPASRIGCLSVLPSVAAKLQSEQRENSVPTGPAGPNGSPCVPPPIVGPSVPNPPPPPGAYTANNAPRLYFPQNSMNPSYNYNYTGSPQVPTAFFYPNPMMPWSTPNFYDINGFIQYNGLSPRATYKPPTTTRYNNSSNNINNNRRTKTRDVKIETRHVNNGTGVVTTTRSNVSGSHPPSALSPHLNNSILGPQTVTSHQSFTGGQTTTGLENSCPNPRSNGSGCSTPNNINNSINGNITCGVASFTQSDYRSTSQPTTTFTTYCPVQNTSAVSNVRIENIDKHDSLVNSSGHISSSSSQDALNPLADLPLLPSLSEPVTTNCSSHTVLIPGEPNFPTSNQQNSLHSQSHHHQSLSQSHRSSYNNEVHSASREAQSQRQLLYTENRSIGGFAQKMNRYDSQTHPGNSMARGGRRKVSTRRDDDVNGHSSNPVNGRGPQRGPAQQNQEIHAKSSHEARKPQFDLQSNLFPPLPTAEEVDVVLPIKPVVAEEKVHEVASQTAWSNDTQKFSDVMKGTVKPKPIIEKDLLPQEASILPPATALVAEISESKLVQLPPVCPTTQTPNHDVANASPVNTISAKPSLSPVAADSSTKTNGQTVIVGRHDRTIQNREQRPVREERRGGPPNGVRRDREYVPGIGRGGPRRDNSNFARQSGNKENRPQGRVWREERPDPDGWITKTPRENRNNRDHRYQQQHSHQQSTYENKNSCPTKHLNVMVNGDSSLPHLPKSETEVKATTAATIPITVNCKVETNNTKNMVTCTEKISKDEIINDKESSAMNNNEGEHKPSWAKMALASKDKMERLSAELKEKEEQERIKKSRTTRPNTKLPERSVVGRESKPFRRENFLTKEKERERDGMEKAREFRGPDGRNSSSFRPKEPIRPKSPK